MLTFIKTLVTICLPKGIWGSPLYHIGTEIVRFLSNDNRCLAVLTSYWQIEALSSNKFFLYIKESIIIIHFISKSQADLSSTVL